jgi:PAS domain S-box-containing protein
MTEDNAHRAEKTELGLNLAQLEVIYRTAPVGLCVLDRELCYVRINDWLAEINGHPPEAHIGRTVRQMVPYLADQVEPLYRRVLETGEPLLDIVVKEVMDPVPGVERVFRDQYHPLFDASGNVIGVNVVVEEVTELKQEEERRRASEAQFRALANSMPQLVWTAGPDGTVDYYNERYQEFAGIRPDPDGSWQWAPVVHPDDLARTEAAWQQAVSSGETYTIEHRVLHADGRYCWYLSRGVPIRDEEGHVVKWYGTATDIHDLRTAEEALRTKEAEQEKLIAELAQERASLRELNETLEQRIQERTQSLERAHQEMQKARDLFYTLFHASPNPTVLTRPEDGLVLDANNAYLSFFGFTREEQVGKTTVELGIFWDPADRAKLMRLLVTKGSVREVELQLRTAGGRRTVLLSIDLIEIGGEWLALSAFFDITPLVAAQAQIRHLASELSLAEERERRRIAQVLHDDIQQMLVAVQIMLQMHSWDAEPGQEREALERANAYLADTLTATRRLSSELSSPPVNSRKVKDSLALLATFMDERYHFSVTVRADQAGEIADEDLRGVVIRLVRELLFNVVKHAAVREAHVVAWTEAGELLIRVEDNGRGFDPASLHPGEFSSSFGLGSMDERLALFGGRLEVTSIPGSGTQVTIRVPAGEPDSSRTVR